MNSEAPTTCEIQLLSDLYTLLLHRAFRRITSIINQQLHLHKFHIKAFKNT